MEQTGQNVSPMSNEGRNAYVIEHLEKKLIELLKKKPLNDISVSELCERAGVGRTSFYRNFESREDIIKGYVNQLFGNLIRKNFVEPEPKLSESIHIIFSHFEEHREFYGLLNKRGLILLLKDVIIEIFGAKPEQSAVEAYTKAFAAYSLYGWIEVWFNRGMQESAEELAQLVRAAGL